MLALSSVLLNFSFQFSLLFVHVGSQAATAAYVVYPISDVAKNVGSTFLVCSVAQWKDFKLILTVKMQTRHPIEAILVVSFG